METTIQGLGCRDSGHYPPKNVEPHEGSMENEVETGFVCGVMGNM